MEGWLERTELLLGEEKLNILRNSNVLVVGVGGVGAYAAEMIVRAGVGRMTIADADKVSESNINRQLVALHSTIGREKCDILAERLKDINPRLELTIVNRFIKDDETDALLDSDKFDYVVDAIDTLSPKLALIKGALDRGIRLVSSMGAGAKCDWVAWTATLAADKATFEEFIKPMYNLYNESRGRVPMSDYYHTDDNTHIGMQARSVVGGYWIKLLSDKMTK